VHRLHIHNVNIFVDSEGQQKILKENNMWLEYPSEEKAETTINSFGGVPTFPLNTDGIDVSGNDVLIENCTIQNFDDAVVVKPSDGNSYWGDCSHNINVRNIDVIYSVGMSIGSISPGAAVECISDVIFQNIQMKYPFKAIYIKTNPGTVGSGIVNNITYKNMIIHGSTWYPIWIGPQQETTGFREASCSFLYPLNQHCPTQPLITISDIFLQNITLTGSVLVPGIILGNETNPITNMVFDSVQNSGFYLIDDEYMCEDTFGTVSSDSNPLPGCLTVQ
jgi:polygalacturonase